MASREITAEIRDAQNHESDSMGDDADVTIIDDTLHGRASTQQFPDADGIRIYLYNGHDQGFDVAIQHTRPSDTDFSQSVVNQTVTMGAGGTVATAYLDGPVGNLNFNLQLGALTSAPTSGQFTAAVMF